jgi:hypothetical protein
MSTGEYLDRTIISGYISSLIRIAASTSLLLIISLFVPSNAKGEDPVSDHNSQYLTSPTFVDSIYSFLSNGNTSGAVEAIRKTGDAKMAIQAWIGVQCDINNVKGDPVLSEAIARPGVEFALENGFKQAAAILLHNISAFHSKAWDEGIDPKVIPGIIEASHRQVGLRECLDDKTSLAWAYWDHGLALLGGGRAEEAVSYLNKGAALADSLNDRDTAAWCRLFIGKAWVKYIPSRLDEGKALMLQSAAVIEEVGEDWEREEIVNILAVVGLKR